jgi:2-keto-4-pentenoate hydratase/2-oxohepta-3-ene-1,7-dioic acid hydratase in catechol pathway
MRIGRVGNVGSEKPVVFVDGKAIFVDSIIPDWNRKTLSDGALDKVKNAGISNWEKVDITGQRIGSPIANPTKVICVGLNYLLHIKESNAETPKEPVIFMKAPDTIIGPNDDIVIPPGSLKTDYEVELAIVIGKRASYLKSPDDSQAHVLGYSISQDVSERHWQIERSGQWVKGKSFPTFNPIGPAVVTPDEINAHDLRLWCSVDGEIRQDSRTSDLLFGLNHIVWYISQFMELFPGDVINSGTPFGVGMGFNPTRYLTAGQTVVTGIEGIGEITSRTVAYKG